VFLILGKSEKGVREDEGKGFVCVCVQAQETGKEKGKDGKGEKD